MRQGALAPQPGAMCRLFGLRSVTSSQVHRSLLSAENALAVQSQRHGDGWGVAWYHAGVPHLIKGACSAFQDRIFARLSGIVASQTVLAHIRKATVGDVHVLNSHPFQFGRWVFAHNGDVLDFSLHRETLLAEIDPCLRKAVLGDTDSEVLFFLLLTALRRRGDLETDELRMPDVAAALGETLRRVRDLCDEPADRGEGRRVSKLTVILTDGRMMVGACSGRELHWSTWKRKCLDREHCPFLAGSCEAPTPDGHVNHLLLSSEPLQGDNYWEVLPQEGIVGVDAAMRLWTGTLQTGARLVIDRPLAA